MGGSFNPFDLLFQPGEHGDGAFGMRPDPPFVNGVDREGIEVIPSLSPTPLHDDQVGRFQHLQMLHDCAPVQFPELRAKCPCGQRLVPERIQDRPSLGRGKRSKHLVLLFLD